MTGPCTVDGSVMQVVFQNEENGYAVLRILTDDGEAVTAVGVVPGAAPGEELHVEGVWTSHPAHGEQVEIRRVERRLPSTCDGILSYLGSGAVRGLGPITAQRLVERFGENTLRVLDEEPELLAGVKGVTARRAAEIGQSWRLQMGLRRLMDFLAGRDLPVALALRLYRQYGPDALTALKANPYLLSDERYGVDFSAVDRIALGLGVSGDSGERLEAALLFELSHNQGNGHVFLPRDKLIAAASQLIDCPADRAEIFLDRLLEKRAVVSERVANVDACYLRRLYEAETFVAEKLLRMLSFRADRVRDVEKLMEQIQREQGLTYAPAQRRAVELAAREGVVLLTGGPGTGKTTSVRGMVDMLDRLGCRVLLLAPTGRAAQRLGELCAREAQTVHRALGMTWDENTGAAAFQKNERDPLECDAVVVDEMSMVDLPLMAALLHAVKDDCRLIMVGDPDQLPSVGPGNVLRDILRSGRVESVELTEVFRQASQSAIIRAAHAVDRGQLPELKNESGGDLFFLRRRDPEAAAELVVELVSRRLPRGMGVEPGQIQVLTPTRKGPCGSAALNRALQAALNPPAPDRRQRAWGDALFRTGDRVMQIRNDYDVLWTRDDGSAGAGVFNGDVGTVEDMDSAGELLRIRFDDRVAVYTADMLSELELAYAVTVHKSQGSEYRAVVLAALPAAPALMVRGVLYTGVTRARELLVIVGDDGALRRMAENDRQQRRYSGLRWRLRE